MLWFTVLAVWWCACVGGAVPTTEKPFYPEAALAHHFAVFKTTYRKQYATTEEERHRQNAFKKNLATINELNAIDEHAVYDINEDADMTEDEIEAKYKDIDVGSKQNVGNTEIMLPENLSANPPPPESFDWRDKGVVSKPRDQKSCNASYVFSIVGNIESHYFMAKKKHMTFSIQQAIDCDKSRFSNGCKGGDMAGPCIYYIINGVMAEDDYKYEGRQSECAYDHEKVIDIARKCVFMLFPEKLLDYAMPAGPLSTVIDGRQLQWYRSGIITQCAFKGYNYVTLLTGYGHDKKGVKYWSLQNSRGENWGENGYVRIKRGVECLGIAKSNFNLLWPYIKH